MDLFIKNAKIVTSSGLFIGGLTIHEGRFSTLVNAGNVVNAEKTIDAQGMVILPGLVDGHVHFSEPGREHWEGYETGSRAAAAGGITTVLDMPLNANPPTISVENLRTKRDLVHEKCIVDYAHWGGLVNNNLDELSGLNKEGVVGFKAFLSDSGTEYARIDDDLLFEGLRIAGELGSVIGLHAENEWVTRWLADSLKRMGRKDRAAWSESRPPSTELEAIQRACFWAQQAGGSLHLVHVTIGDGVRVANNFRKKGAKITIETCPHYLFFDTESFERIGPAAKCAPPIRSKEVVEDLWKQVRNGMVDTIGSDHSPCLWEEKAAGMDDIWQAWGGVSGIQCTLPVLFTEGVHKRRLSLQRLAQLTATNPAKIFGLFPQKGVIQPGADADFVLVDPNEEWTMNVDHLLTRNRHSAYLGSRFKGRVHQTYVRGKLVYSQGEVVAQPGWGRLLKRNETVRV